MKLTVNRGDLLRALGHAAAIVDKRSTLPILANVLLVAGESKLEVIASDLDLQIALEVAATVEVEGSRTVSASLLHGIIREFPDGSAVGLEYREERLHVRCGRSHYKLQSLPAADFPVITPDQAGRFDIPAKELFVALKRVEFAQSDETATRSYLCGVFLDMEGDRLCFAANDGFCMAQAFIDAPEGVAIEGAILPRKLVATLTKLVADHGGDVGLAVHDQRVVVSIGSTELVSKLLEGPYPDYRRIIPESNGRVLSARASDLEGALRRAAIMLAGAKLARAVRLDLSAEKLTISAAAQETGDAVEEAPCAWTADDFAVGFNSRHLLSALAAAGDGEIEAHFGDEVRPVLFTTIGDDSARWVVGTMRV